MAMNGLQMEENGGDLRQEGAGFVVAGVEAQVIEHVLLANRGEYREEPLLGAEVRKMQHGTPGRLWGSRARQMLQEAGVGVSRVDINERGEIRVE